MKLNHPFFISSRLMPAIEIAKDFILSFDSETENFILDLPDGEEYVISDFRFPECRIKGDTNESVLQDGFAAVLGFLSACAESRKYGTSRYNDPMNGENSDLFPSHIGELAEQFSDEIGMLELEIEENKGLIEA